MCLAFFNFIQLRDVGLPLASSIVIWGGGMGCEVLEAGGGGGRSSLNVLFSGGRLAGATATVAAVTVLMEVATIADGNGGGSNSGNGSDH